jgi:hypothetical protein
MKRRVTLKLRFGEMGTGIRVGTSYNGIRSYTTLWIGSVRDDRMPSVSGKNHVGDGIEAKELMSLRWKLI